MRVEPAFSQPVYSNVIWLTCTASAARVMPGGKTDGTAAPEKKTADGCKENGDGEECREDCAWGEDGLPSLETLLLEGGI